jgi:hypothetical protein
MSKQLDISYLLERIEYLEMVSTVVLNEKELKGLHLREKLSLKEATIKRRAFKLRKKAQ